MSVHTPFWANPSFDRNKPMLVYGYGILCLRWLRPLIAEEFNILAIFDRNPKYHGQTINGIPILPPERIGDFSRDVNVFISNHFCAYELTNMFRSLGYTNIYWNYMPEVPEIDLRVSMRAEYAAIAAANKDKVERARALFGEEKSLEVFDAAIDAYTNGNFERLGLTATRQTVAEQGIFDFGDDEVYADVGAYTGDTAFAFVHAMKYKYKHIYSFEPAELEFKLIERTFEYEGLKNAEAHQFAICNKVGYVSFSGNNSEEGARISEEGTATVPSTTLDTFFLENEREILLPTYLHMDIEGAEIDALEGGRRLIAKCLPKLSISAYHKLEHYWEVPLKIDEIAPGKYEFFMRHHGNWYDTMCLAQPKK